MSKSAINFVDMENKDKLKEYIGKRKKKIDVPVVGVQPTKIPWYKRELLEIEFTHKKAKDGKLYIHHDEWSPTIWIGPYDSVKEVKEIIASYISASLTKDLSKKLDSRVHSLIIENAKEFF